jgi:hypothetical protein
VVLRRFPHNPIISPDMLQGALGNSINGPSLIRVPDWLLGRLGRFYLYFAHHSCDHIRLGFANSLEGPWQIYEPGTLHLRDVPGCRHHIASPDVHVDTPRREIRMYFHGPSAVDGAQLSFLATSADGLHFHSGTDALAEFYLRVVPWRGEWVGMTKGGVLYRSQSGLAAFRRLPEPAFPMSGPEANEAGDVRHVALHVVGHHLQVYFSLIGDRPESILRASVDLDRPPEEWRAGNIETILKPEMTWEGTDVPLGPSRSGASVGREHAVRDPAIFSDCGRTYLLYSVAGESGLAIAELSDAHEKSH